MIRCLALTSVLVLGHCTRSAAPRPPEPIPGWATVQATGDCAPWDGPAVAIYFTKDSATLDSISAPYLRVSLWKELDQLAGHEWKWPGDSEVGAASLCQTEDSCQAATAGVVQLDPMGAEPRVAGSLRLEFGSEPPIEGRFVAVWRQRTGPCR